MKKKSKKIVGLLIMIIGLLLFSTKEVNAEASGGFKIKREVYGITNHVNNTFTYKVVNDSSNPAVATNLPTNIGLTMNCDPDSANIATSYGIIPGSSWKAINYPTIGTYKFIVTEETSSDSTTIPLATEKYYVYIYVSNKVDDHGDPTGEQEITYIGSKENDEGEKKTPSMIDNIDPTTGEEVQPRNDKEDDNLFTSRARFTNITITSDVIGTQANKDRYYKYRVEIDGNIGDRYIIIGQDPEITFKGEKIQTKNIYTVGEENYIYLKAGQSVTIGLVNSEINQIKIGANYRVTLVDKDESSSQENKANSNPKTNTIHFVQKEGWVLSDIFKKIIPFAIIILLSLGAYKMSKKENN